MNEVFDAAILGAGAAGLMAAATARKGGASVVVLDHAAEPGRKILISGGGRCNFTNLDAKAENFLSANRHFMRSALAGYTPRDFLALVERHGIGWQEKAEGQLFCSESARDIVSLLLREAEGCVLRFNTPIRGVTAGDVFRVQTDAGEVQARSLVLATGGLSIPKLGASDLSLRIARQFGLEIVKTVPGLVPLTLETPLPDLAGVSLPVRASIGKTGFTDGMVFTHRGLSGPAILQISSYQDGPLDAPAIDMMPGRDARSALGEIKKARPRAEPTSLLQDLPQRLARHIASNTLADLDCTLANLPDKRIIALAEQIGRWRPRLSGTEGYAKAEVMKGGIDTRALLSKTLESRDVPGLFAIGEAVDVTGWLGGYNFQWAWSSGVAAGRAIAARR
ncbi:BaiN/RdsA family NAD(P)/FAD-dependent oxidoreductase [Asaia krungthepensis]|uniref:Glutathione reductase n=1 Tax=Asaia krungthepensis NRIC 0535 TaxID=1307925 RepID=A0ABQ0PZC3_9PROT|nr:NAD(P)/FAD-dependent oxidoreductase [Asaia krungthepensis]GBQ85337.1 glutathione reductase [Asaia krungthepensis NRIC 0535]